MTGPQCGTAALLFCACVQSAVAVFVTVTVSLNRFLFQALAVAQQDLVG
jgi:hypothetical protein